MSDRQLREDLGDARERLRRMGDIENNAEVTFCCTNCIDLREQVRRLQAHKEYLKEEIISECGATNTGLERDLTARYEAAASGSASDGG